MPTRVPVAMIEGRIVQNVRRVPPRTVYYFTDGSYSVVEHGIPTDIELKLSEVEIAVSDHLEQMYPPAHTGNHSPTDILTELTVRWFVDSTAHTTTVSMQSNSVLQAISAPFDLTLELANHTMHTYTDIKFHTVAIAGMSFLDSTRNTNLPVVNSISGVHSTTEMQLQGFKLAPGESGYFKFKAQQSSGTPITGPAAYGIHLIDLSYLRDDGTTRIQLPTLPLNAPFTLII